MFLNKRKGSSETCLPTQEPFFKINFNLYLFSFLITQCHTHLNACYLKYYLYLMLFFLNFLSGTHCFTFKGTQWMGETEHLWCLQTVLWWKLYAWSLWNIFPCFLFFLASMRGSTRCSCDCSPTRGSTRPSWTSDDRAWGRLLCWHRLCRNCVDEPTHWKPQRKPLLIFSLAQCLNNLK